MASNVLFHCVSKMMEIPQTPMMLRRGRCCVTTTKCTNKISKCIWFLMSLMIMFLEITALVDDP
eukprot:8582573-Prorocentrum_lima.AAC.1